MTRLTGKQESKARTTSTGTAATRARQQKWLVGHAALSGIEREVLAWSRERRLREFQRANEGVDTQFLESKLLYIDSMTLDNGEILDALRTNPKLTWEMVRDMFLGGPVDGYTSTFHGLEDIDYPEHFWKRPLKTREKSDRILSQPSILCSPSPTVRRWSLCFNVPVFRDKLDEDGLLRVCREHGSLPRVWQEM